MDTLRDCKDAAHLKAFNTVLDLVLGKVIEHNEVVQFLALGVLYRQELEESSSPNPDFRSEKLKTQLENHSISELIAFAKINPGDNGCITYNLVYNAKTSVADAVGFAYKLGCSDKYEDVAQLLHSKIRQGFNESKSLPWPPTADDLEVKDADELLPPDIKKFLNLLIFNDMDVAKCEKSSRIVLSIGQVGHDQRFLVLIFIPLLSGEMWNEHRN